MASVALGRIWNQNKHMDGFSFAKPRESGRGSLCAQIATGPQHGGENRQNWDSLVKLGQSRTPIMSSQISYGFFHFLGPAHR